MADNKSKSKSKSKKKVLPSAKKTSKSNTPKKLKELSENLSQEKDKYLRLFAEFENFKKRTAKERIELFKTVSLKKPLLNLTTSGFNLYSFIK